MGNKSKPAMPAKLRARADRATARLQSRPIAPDIELTTNPGGWDYANPYLDEDEDAWVALLCEAFGTRQEAVAYAFINHLAMLCSVQWTESPRAWRPNEYELRLALAIVQSLDPRNEAEAALAAQAVAVHLSTMKVGRLLGTMTSVDTRTAATLAALAKVYAGQLETMQKLKGRKTSRQRITVSYEKHVHTHQHAHLEGGPAPHSGGQAQEPSDYRNGGNNRGSPLVEHEFCPALPGPDSSGVVVPMPRKQGKGSLS